MAHADRFSLRFRPIRPQDETFLAELYASTRRQELLVLDWSEAEKEAFLRSQFEAQHTFYQQQFTKASFELILFKKKPIGRLYVDRRPDEIRLVDIALLPEYRGTGIGTALLKDLFAEATKVGKPVRIHVEHNNPAMRLYTRLGFTKLEENGVYHLMEWLPPTKSN